MNPDPPFPLAPPEGLAGNEFAEPAADPVAQRRADIEAKQAIVARILSEMACEAALLFAPAHVAWFTGGMKVRGLIADTERPGIYVTDRGRWLVCSNVDTQRLFDEELDRLGFQLKEWRGAGGRAVLLGEVVAGKKVAADRPFPGMPLLNDRLRLELRPLAPSDRERYRALGQSVAHAVEATARTMARGQTEEEVAGQLAHRLYHHGIEADAISVTADGRGRRYRRAGFTSTGIRRTCVLQATGTRGGLFVTCTRSVSFGREEEFKREHDLACKVAGVYWSLTRPGQTIAAAGEVARRLTTGTDYEFDWRESQPGYGTGWVAAEELRRAGQDEKLVAGQAVVWQARVGAVASVDTLLVSEGTPVPVTPPGDWPFKRIRLGDQSFDIPDLLLREE